MQAVTLIFYPNVSKRNTNNKIPIYLRLTYLGKKVEGRLDKIYDIQEIDLLRWNAVSNRLDEKDSDLNDYLHELNRKFKEIRKECLIKGENKSLHDLRDLLLAGNEVAIEPTVILYARKYLKEEIEASHRKEGTKKNYRNAIGQLVNYLEWKGCKNLKMSEFNYVHADGFKKYLESKDTLIPNKKCNQVVSSSTKIKNVRPVFLKAIDEELIQKNPFAKVKVSFKSPLAKSISIQQIKAIFGLSLPETSSFQFTKDIFLFMCLTGLSYCDAINLSTDVLQYLPAGKVKIDTTRNKSGSKVKQVMCKQAQTILEKYWDGSQSFLGNRVFPFETGESLNRKIKLIAALAGISYNISTKTARITCSELLHEAELEEQLLIDSFMGWSSHSKIRNRYFDPTDQKLIRFAEKLDQYLAKYLSTEVI